MTATTPLESPGQRLRAAWKRLAPLPGGRRLFTLMVGRMVPYTGALGARVEELEPGYARITLRQRRGIENHLKSVHAVALANLGEFTTGLAMLTALPENSRGIAVHLGIEYLKKARGRLTAECRCDTPPAEGEMPLVAEIRDEADDVVARAEVRWLIRPKGPGRA